MAAIAISLRAVLLSLGFVLGDFIKNLCHRMCNTCNTTQTLVIRVNE